MVQKADDVKKYIAQLAQQNDDTVDTHLGQALQRQDCPDKMVLGDYELELLNADDQAKIKAHVTLCLFCQAELAQFSQSLAHDDLLAALPASSDVGVKTDWVEQAFEFGQAWLEQESGRWRQIVLSLSSLGTQGTPNAALSGLMSGSTDTETFEQQSRVIAPFGADFELEIIFSPLASSSAQNACQVTILLTRFNHFGDFSGASITLQGDDQIHSQETNALGEVIFAEIPCDQLNTMRLSMTLPTD
ncbi:MAG: hypothetical protein AAF629_01090 [Chloroflexota bacterium]